MDSELLGMIRFQPKNCPFGKFQLQESPPTEANSLRQADFEVPTLGILLPLPLNAETKWKI
jgi:hypothetical protein